MQGIERHIAGLMAARTAEAWTFVRAGIVRAVRGGSLMFGQRFGPAVVLIVLVLLPRPGFLLPLAPQDLSAAPKDVRVLAVLSSDNSIYAEGLAGIRSGTAATVDVIYLNVLEAEVGSPTEYLSRLDRDGRYPLIIAVGSEAGRRVYASVRKTPVVFSMLSVPRALPVAPEKLCGVSMRIPMDAYFQALRELAPHARRVHAFYSTARGEFLTGEGEYADARHGLLYSREKISNVALFGERLRRLKGKIDAFYVVADPLFDRERFTELSRFAVENKVILFSGFRSLVSAGATFGIAPDYSKIGSLTGRMVERILHSGKKCSTEGIIMPDRSAYFFYLNAPYAQRSGVRVPPAIAERAQKVRLLRAGIEFFHEGRFKSARIVFENILERDPGNPAAQDYRDRIVAKQSGAAIAALLQEAARKIAARDYTEAREAFERVLSLNPRSPAARAGLVRVSALQQKRGEELYASGQVFAALRTLGGAVRTNAENRDAQERIVDIRAREAHRLAALIHNGREMYSVRNYAGAIETFSNALLLAPGHKVAGEYVRLSRQKYAAMERLRRKIRQAR